MNSNTDLPQLRILSCWLAQDVRTLKRLISGEKLPAHQAFAEHHRTVAVLKNRLVLVSRCARGRREWVLYRIQQVCCASVPLPVSRIAVQISTATQ
jgi:hypothetical protein